MLICDKDRVKNKIETFSKFGDTGQGGVTRFSLSKEDLQARSEFVRRMEAIGVKTVADDMANVYATLPGTEKGLPAIVMASHTDSVRNGGNYDGILGVITAMEVVETIATKKIPHRHPITAMIWTNEEGSLYPPAMMSSGVVCGKFAKENIIASKSPEGKTFGDALKQSGYVGGEVNRLNPKEYTAMLELHIEQGPVLESEGMEIGVVEGVVGMVNYRIRTYGQTDHAGTTPMSFRRDALLAAASAIKYLHTELDKLDPNLVYTTGNILCHPNIHTCIPDAVDFSLDARHKDPAVIKQVVDIIKNMPKEFDKCEVNYEEAWARKTVKFNEELVALVQRSADAYGYTSKKMYSGAGHDAQYVADIMPTTMLFVPSKDGHSHCEPEHTSLDACCKGINVMLRTVLEIDKK
ncbi:MAG: Zn-dependent hydrolase [Endomicrobiia bacterium]|nr:Zn-dependent hydrolase [Endomicrobiia bacterium]